MKRSFNEFVVPSTSASAMNPVYLAKDECDKFDPHRLREEDAGKKPKFDHILAQTHSPTNASSSETSGQVVLQHLSFGNRSQDQDEYRERDFKHPIRDEEKEDESRAREREGLEEILEKGRENLHDAMNPVFLPKAECDKFDPHRLREEDAGKKPKFDHLLAQTHSPTNASSSETSGQVVLQHLSFGNRSQDQDEYRERDFKHPIRGEEKEDESRAREREGLEEILEKGRENLHDAIEDQYLEFKKLEKPMIEPSKNFQFSFDRENTEDASRDLKVSYHNSLEAPLLIVREYPGGMDGMEQKMLAAKKDKELRDEILKRDSIEEIAAQRLKDETAGLYDAFDVRARRCWSQKTTDLISQQVTMVEESDKMQRLLKLLDGLGDKAAIVFINTMKSANTLSESLNRSGYRVTAVHEGMSQDLREVSLEGFRMKRYNVLCATNALGRGIDIPDVAHVINFDMPKDIAIYRHHIGHTGRAGNAGVATTLLTLDDSEVFYDLRQMLIHSNSAVPPELATLKVSKFSVELFLGKPARRQDTVLFH